VLLTVISYYVKGVTSNCNFYNYFLKVAIQHWSYTVYCRRLAVSCWCAGIGMLQCLTMSHFFTDVT